MNVKSIAYWTATAPIALETLAGGATDLGGKRALAALA